MCPLFGGSTVIIVPCYYLIVSQRTIAYMSRYERNCSELEFTAKDEISGTSSVLLTLEIAQASNLVDDSETATDGIKFNIQLTH